MAKGERNFSTQGQQVTKYSNEPFPPGDYELKMVSAKAEVKPAAQANPRGAPYVGGIRFIATGTGAGGKDKSLFHSFYLSLEPGNDGKVAPNRSGGITDFANALGDVYNGKVISVSTPGGEKGGQILDPKEIDCLDPIQLCKWLKERDGAMLKARVKVQAGDAKYGPKNIVDYFHPAEVAAEEEDEELEEEIEEDEETEEETEEEVEEDEEPAPPAKVSKVKPLGAKTKKK